MVSVERIKQFTNIPSEAEWRKKDLLPPPNWPSKGNVELEDLQVSFHASFLTHLDSVLNISKWNGLLFCTKFHRQTCRFILTVCYLYESLMYLVI